MSNLPAPIAIPSPTKLLDPKKRYYCVTKPKDAEGRSVFALIEGIPDPAKPHDPKKDGRGEEVLSGLSEVFWVALKAAGLKWRDRSYAKLWAVDEARPGASPGAA